MSQEKTVKLQIDAEDARIFVIVSFYDRLKYNDCECKDYFAVSANTQGQ